MASTFGNILGWRRDRRRPPATTDLPADDRLPVRYRPGLVAELLVDGATARSLMRALLDACRSRDEDLQIARLRNFADCFHRTTLLKGVQFYPYLNWALGRDTGTMIHFRSVQADVQRHALGIEAILTEDLGAPWNRGSRRHFVADVARAASALSQLLRQEESTLFPLYLPPDQYRHITAHASA